MPNLPQVRSEPPYPARQTYCSCTWDLPQFMSGFDLSCNRLRLVAWLHTNRAAMNPSLELLRALAAVPHGRQAALAEQGIREGRWTAEHVAAYHGLPDSEPAPRERKPRAPTVTRRMRLS